MIEYTIADTAADLEGILALQKANMPEFLSREEITSQGFLTVKHNLQLLEKMNTIEQHVIAKVGDKVVAYLLAMTAVSKNEIPVLLPMFDIFDSVSYREKLISSYKYLIVGQVCVDKQYRGMGVLDHCYDFYKNRFKEKYDFAITVIAFSNQRSIHAHLRLGFREIYRYYTDDGKEWSLVIWDWDK